MVSPGTLLFLSVLIKTRVSLVDVQTFASSLGVASLECLGFDARVVRTESETGPVAAFVPVTFCLAFTVLHLSVSQFSSMIFV